MTRTLPRLLAALLGPLVIAGSLVVTAAPASAATPLAAFSVTSNQAPSVFGQSVTLFANLTGTTTSPTGTVDFFDGAGPLCTAQPLNGSDPSSVASCTTSALSVGNHGITAAYSGDVTYSPGTTSSFSQVVAAASTTTGLGAAPTPSTFSESVTLTATVLATAPGTGTPTGAVAFKDNGVDIAGCSAQTLTAGSTTCVTTGLGVASHPLTAVYAGSSSYFTSTSSSVPQNVTLAATTTAVVTSDNTTLSGQSVTFTATTAPTSPATIAPSAGTVSFNRNGTPIASCGTQAITTGTSACSTSTLPTGTGLITAVYSGNANYGTSTSTGINQTVGQGSTTVALTANHNPASSDQSVTFTATMSSTSPSVGVPTGSVAFFRVRDNLTREWIGTSALTAGVATVSTNSLPFGANTISAIYRGSDDSLGSNTTATETIYAGTATTVVSTRSPAMAGRFIGFQATVSSTVAGAGTPTGAVAFFRVRSDRSREWIGNANLRGGVAKVRTDQIPVGTHTIVAVFRGGPDYGMSTGNVTQVIAG